MAPPAADIDVQSEVLVPETLKKSVGPVPVPIKTSTSSRLDGPLKYSGSLDSYEQFDVTNIIGLEFPKLQLSEILYDDTKIRDLAILGELKHPGTPEASVVC